MVLVSLFAEGPLRSLIEIHKSVYSSWIKAAGGLLVRRISWKDLGSQMAGLCCKSPFSVSLQIMHSGAPVEVLFRYTDSVVLFLAPQRPENQKHLSLEKKKNKTGRTTLMCKHNWLRTFICRPSGLVQNSLACSQNIKYWIIHNCLISNRLRTGCRRRSISRTFLTSLSLWLSPVQRQSHTQWEIKRYYSQHRREQLQVLLFFKNFFSHQ